MGQGVSLSNVMFNNSSDTISCNAIGVFGTGSIATNLGMSEGIILGTGDVSFAMGPNNSSGGSVPSNCTSQSLAALSSIATASINDCAVLEFDFVPQFDSIKFDYVFASEEYPEYVCSDYNDIFGFFLSGPNPEDTTQPFINKNIALIPGTTLPITINSINNGCVGENGDIGEDGCILSNSQYYVTNNQNSLQYDGFTVVLQAMSAVIPGETYHLTMTIADLGDDLYDSGVFLKAKSLSSINDSVYVTICHGECYDFYDTTVCDPGEYYYETQYLQQWLFLSQRPEPQTRFQHDTIIENQLPWFYCDMTFTDTVHADSIILSDNFGCDSLIVFDLYVYWNQSVDFDTVICDAQTPFFWYGHLFNQTESVVDTLVDVHGADSVVTINVTVIQSSESTVHEYVTENQLPWEYASTPFSAPVDSIDFVFTNMAGCDSIVHYGLTIFYNYNEIFDTTICDDALPLTWREHFFSDSFTLVDSLIGIHGEDSILTFSLNVNPSFSQYDSVFLCEGDSYTLNGETYTTSGNHEIVLLTTQGCDSITHLTLQFHPTYMIDEEIDLCDGDIYSIGNDIYSTAGTYVEQLHTIQGCDSTVSLTLFFWPNYYNDDYMSICLGEAIYYNGDYYDREGLYQETFQSIHGCDSLIRLFLTVVSRPQAIIDANPSHVTYEDNTVRLSDISKSGVAREWYIEGDFSGNERTITYQYPIGKDSVEVLLVSFNSLLCADSTLTSIYFDKGIVWNSNAFTPGEATNNCWCIKFDDILTAECTIYTRQGQFVKKMNPLEECWDGTKEGHECSQGSYVWILNYTTREEPRIQKVAKGTVLLLR